jgi:hypothetical protein
MSDRTQIDRVTTHLCDAMRADYAYCATQGRDMDTCVNCNVHIPVRYAQFAVLCKDCRYECTDASDVETETCVWCGTPIE